MNGWIDEEGIVCLNNKEEFKKTKAYLTTFKKRSKEQMEGKDTE
jgi:predicted transcriptional regulator